MESRAVHTHPQNTQVPPRGIRETITEKRGFREPYEPFVKKKEEELDLPILVPSEPHPTSRAFCLLDFSALKTRVMQRDRERVSFSSRSRRRKWRLRSQGAKTVNKAEKI